MDIKTVDSSKNLLADEIYQRQKENVSRMRASILALSSDSGVSTRAVIQEITGMRIYHQLMRIIKYTELMDKLETKLYESIECAVESANSAEPSTWAALLTIQEKLQKSMIESHKLLQPYLDIQELAVVDLAKTESDVSSSASILSSEDRDRLRMNAQNVIQQLQLSGGDSDVG